MNDYQRRLREVVDADRTVLRRSLARIAGRRRGHGSATAVFGVLLVLGFVSMLFWGGCRTYHSVIFNKDCAGFLKNAADANDIPTAEKRLTIALDYINKHNLTTGHTNVLWNTPDCDVAFWYENLTNALTELRESPPDADSLTQSNVLMKLKETLLDDTSEGVTVTVPGGISIYPNNAAYAVWGILSFAFLGIGCLVLKSD